MVDASTARRWVERWDRQQEGYVADREERFAVIADVVQAVAGREDPFIVDAGCGPGSLAARLVDRMPGATVVGVDADPVLLALAGGAYGDREGLRFVDADLRQEGWTETLGLDRPADAVVSTTALHWLYREELARTYKEFAGLLRSGGAYVDGDHMFAGPDLPVLDGLQRAVHAGRERRVGLQPDDDWQQWWDAVTADPELADPVARRGQRPLEHNHGGDVWYDERI
ncbi:MAG: class I SAM-dependent methyltransferase, partial [Nocardioidaceae bacterium]